MTSRVSREYQELAAQLSERGYAVVHNSTEEVQGYQFHATVFRGRHKSFLCVHNPDGIATFERLSDIAQADHARSPLVDECVAAAR
jgi:hypothetical protein